MSGSLGLYIHIPFCKSKCPYCNFYSVTDRSNLIDKYIQVLCNQIQYWGKNLDKEIDTIYFGGGTPSLLESKKVLKILDVIRKNFKVNLSEVSLEVNPADYKSLDFEVLKYAGVNRISIGAQAFDDNELKILGRRHTVNDILDTCECVSKAGIENISVDIILGFPGQNNKSFDKFKPLLEEYNIAHISAYLLKIEEGTSYFKNRKKLNFLSDEESSSMYTYVADELQQYGYNHYEISNFAHLGKESKHNLKYWNLQDYLGIGPGAHSLIDRKRFYYPDDLNIFITKSCTNIEGVGGTIEEYVMLKLRLSSGLNARDFENKFGEEIPRCYFEKAKKFEKLGFVEITKNKIALTTKGLLVSNYIIANIIY